MKSQQQTVVQTSDLSRIQTPFQAHRAFVIAELYFSLPFLFANSAYQLLPPVNGAPALTLAKRIDTDVFEAFISFFALFQRISTRPNNINIFFYNRVLSTFPFFWSLKDKSSKNHRAIVCIETPMKEYKITCKFSCISLYSYSVNE